MGKTTLVFGTVVGLDVKQIKLMQGKRTICVPKQFLKTDVYPNMFLSVNVPKNISLACKDVFVTRKKSHFDKKSANNQLASEAVVHQVSPRSGFKVR